MKTATPAIVYDLKMPPYRYQTPDWLKPQQTRTVYSVGEAIQLQRGIKDETE